jgi:hypothetical protein
VNRASNAGLITFHFCESRPSRNDDSASATAMPLPLATNAAGRQNTSEICAFLGSNHVLLTFVSLASIFCGIFVFTSCET